MGRVWRFHGDRRRQRRRVRVSPQNDLFVAKVRPLFPILLSSVTPAIRPFGFGRMRDQQGAVLFSGVPGREWP